MHIRGVSAFCFRLRTTRKVVDFDVCQNAQKLIGYHSNIPWATAKPVRFVITIHVTTYSERLTKIGLVVAEIFGRICQFYQLVETGAVVTLIISGVTGPMSPTLYPM